MRCAYLEVASVLIDTNNGLECSIIDCIQNNILIGVRAIRKKNLAISIMYIRLFEDFLLLTKKADSKISK